MPITDIHPNTPIATLPREFTEEQLATPCDIELVSALTGFQRPFIQKVLSRRIGDTVALADVLILLDQDAFEETFVPRSRIPTYLLTIDDTTPGEPLKISERHQFLLGNARDLIRRIPVGSVNCIVTSTPYWATRLYREHFDVLWADGEMCAYGHEQTPEGFIRHSIELLYLLKKTLAPDGSIWWNLMDTYNTRTQIRSSAVETLDAMRGNDERGWADYECRRYSAGHAYLKDGEQCLIPSRVAQRASRIGYWVKSVITWKKKGGTLPEPVKTRTSRELEYIIHLSVDRSPFFNKDAYRQLPSSKGGRRSSDGEDDKLTDVWVIPTANGGDGHGAQFPIELPARCIALSTRDNDLVLDPFSGSGSTAIAAARLNRRSLGLDVSQEYVDTAVERLARATATPLPPPEANTIKGDADIPAQIHLPLP